MSATASLSTILTVRAIAASLASYLSEQPSLKAAEVLWASEVIPAFMGSTSTPETCMAVSDALKTDVDACETLTDLALVTEIEVPGGRKIALLSTLRDVIVKAHVKELKTAVWAVLEGTVDEPTEDEALTGIRWTDLPKTVKVERVGKSGEKAPVLDLQAVNNGKVAEALMTITAYTARHDVSFDVSKGRALIKAGTKTIGAVLESGQALTPEAGEKAADFRKAVKADAQIEFACRNFKSLSPARRKTLALHFMGQLAGVESATDGSWEAKSIAIWALYPDSDHLMKIMLNTEDFSAVLYETVKVKGEVQRKLALKRAAN